MTSGFGTLSTAVTVAFALSGPTLPGGHGGKPGLRGMDHVDLTVPDLSKAVTFFRDVRGCAEFCPLGPFPGGDSAWIEDHLNVNPAATIPEMRLMHCGNGSNLEIFAYTAPETRGSISLRPGGCS